MLGSRQPHEPSQANPIFNFYKLVLRLHEIAVGKQTSRFVFLRNELCEFHDDAEHHARAFAEP
jgi:hypothetical protein